MTLAVMQPYFFPYIGYFQLMDSVDTFLFLDDVQYVERGWMNRNRIMLGNDPRWVSFPVHKAPRSTSIMQRRYILGEKSDAVLRQIRGAYENHPHYPEVAPFLEQLMRHPEPSVSGFNGNLLRELAVRLGISCKFGSASAIGNPRGLHGQERILDLCATLGADTYVNAIGGIRLYDEPSFTAASVRLRFLRSTCEPLETKQDGPIHPSIIDLLMRKGFDGVASLLEQRQIIRSPAGLAS